MIAIAQSMPANSRWIYRPCAQALPIEAGSGERCRRRCRRARMDRARRRSVRKRPGRHRRRAQGSARDRATAADQGRCAAGDWDALADPSGRAPRSYH